MAAGRNVTIGNDTCISSPIPSIFTTMSTRPHLLVVDDDREIRALLARYLERNDFRVSTARDCVEARQVWERGHYQLAVLDLMLPGESGLDIARWLRGEDDSLPIIFLTAMGDETNRILGLELGADDYLAKPFNPRELLARIRAVLRRSNPPEKPLALNEGIITFADYRLDLDRRHLLSPQGGEISLTGGEYDLLRLFLQRPNRVLTRDMLSDLLRGRQSGAFDRAIDVAVGRLRRKLEQGLPPGNGAASHIIKTVRSGGYVLAATVHAVPDA
ncbi:DNA-binding response regulator [Acetobacteraceae bacterium EV16G]|uniref:DNA-binding response regulator n=2 Tax=Sorlinia euscelidii TaxID=3081148 RepID=A0ABU7U203_9PROT